MFGFFIESSSLKHKSINNQSTQLLVSDLFGHPILMTFHQLVMWPATGNHFMVDSTGSIHQLQGVGHQPSPLVKIQIQLSTNHKYKLRPKNRYMITWVKILLKHWGLPSFRHLVTWKIFFSQHLTLNVIVSSFFNGSLPKHPKTSNLSTGEVWWIQFLNLAPEKKNFKEKRLSKM